MDFYQGTSLLEKIAVGKICLYKKNTASPLRRETGDAEREIARFDAARDAASEELAALCRKAREKVGEDPAAVFEGHRMLVRDPMYRGFVCDMIREQRVNAEYAVAQAQARFTRMLLDADDACVRERAADVTDISERLLRLLGGAEGVPGEEESQKDAGKGRPGGGEAPAETGAADLPDSGAEDAAAEGPVILAADELTPSEIMRFDSGRICAFIVRRGAANSHAAILARAMNIPAILGVDIREDWAGRTAVVDGCTGEVILDPDEECLERVRRRQREIAALEAAREALRGKETVTRGGRRIRLYANIGEPSDVDAALANDAEGIGLFRSEFLYLQAADWPTEEDQSAAYRAVAGTMKGRPVVIRTLDAGADKQPAYLDLSGEPAGYRGIRVCLDRPEMFRTQLRAILRAGAYGKVAVMFPMITSVEEVRACREQLELAKAELAGTVSDAGTGKARAAAAGADAGGTNPGKNRGSGEAFGDMEVGIMVETPEAVRLSAELAREVDFFCIGTNDLIPLLLGFGRWDLPQDPQEAAEDPAVSDAIRTVIENGHAAGIRVGICGETAADTAWTETLVGMGVDELSVAPGAVLRVREKVRELP